MLIYARNADGPELVQVFDTARAAGLWLRLHEYTWVAGSRALWERSQ
jgi:hypothetical protein